MKIEILPPDVRACIAAGEVIDSPADCVKELVENSLDASAKRIEVEIVKGGKRYIRVKDDGTGIPPEDLPLVVLEGATSKIRRLEDLMHTTTYGFRGEALHAISKVSRMVISSRYFSEDVGREMRIEGGQVKEITQRGMGIGTQVEVFDLFYNLPVRQKFLKKEDTERNRITKLIKLYAMARPDVAFRLISEGKELLALPPAHHIAHRLQEIYNMPFETFERESNGVKVRLSVSVGNKTGEVFLVVNGRPVYNKNLLEYIRRHVGYRKVCLCEVEIPPFLLDVNVHPKKREVRFLKESLVKDLIKESVTRRVYLPYTFRQEETPYHPTPQLIGVLDDTIVIAKYGEYLYFFDVHLLSERDMYERGLSSSKACREAIKAGDRVEIPQLVELLKRWTSFQNREVCPHGRPIYFKLSIGEIYRQLDRKVK
ncbi:DNA mismatch repair protein MutL [Thermocrinis albus DSM 14484]|uniref:DNA mismatch repair protein MutL n=1 Tax=Thermocrinis albus (strain DSM 14484 / JCM 11386 / HI 11/12) TaxID=638303 RepID=D3SMU7_THEAH|nr:DNA mismatch repair protein MutL [Thermocrinis albus DSM 14484]